ncbi:MAG: peroxiredoxin [Leptospira sp.]|nr:peroxiredoxin [Leptospira sp.]
MSLLGKKAPDFSLPDTNGKVISLKDYLNKKVLVVFYPGDETAICTAQLCSYNDGYEEFRKIGVSIVGINPQSVDSHKKFNTKYNFKFPLLSDATGEVCKAYGAMGIFGIKRAMVLVDEQGNVIFENSVFNLFYKNKDDVLKSIQSLIKT